MMVCVTFIFHENVATVLKYERISIKKHFTLLDAVIILDKQFTALHHEVVHFFYWLCQQINYIMYCYVFSGTSNLWSEMNLKSNSTFLLLAKCAFQPLSASFHPCNWHLSALLMLVEWPLKWPLVSSGLQTRSVSPFMNECKLLAEVFFAL